jgi:hypothetical protein
VGDRAPSASEARGSRGALRVCAASGRRRRRPRTRARRAPRAPRRVPASDRPASDGGRRRPRPRRARGRVCALLRPAAGPRRPRLRRSHGRRAIALRDLGRASRILSLRRRLRRGGVRGGVRAARPGGGGATRRDARDRASADQHHARRARRLATGSRLHPSGRARPLPCPGRGDRARAPGRRLAAVDGGAGGACRGAPRGRAPPSRVPRRAERALRSRVRGDLPRAPRADARGYDVFGARPSLSAVEKVRAVATLRPSSLEGAGAG